VAPTARGSAWTNWAGTQRCAPAEVVEVRGVEDVVAALRRAELSGAPVKPVGAGHSFTDIACTEGVQLRLDRFDRVIDCTDTTVTVEAGITLGRLGAELASRGLAMENLGDIAYQSLAGAISTGTHGTGLRKGGLPTQVVGLELVAADGSVLRCGPDLDRELFDCARVGLGALGVLTTVTLEVVPAFRLRAVEEPMRLPAVLEQLDELVEKNEHFEFFYVPHTDWCLTKRNNPTEDPPTGGRRRRLAERYLFENVVFGAACYAGRLRPSLVPRFARLAPASGRAEWVERSDKVFTSPRLVRFAEMEYAVPREAAAEVVTEIRRFIDRSGLAVSFPVEVRFAAADDICLSTAHGRETCYVAVHMFKGVPYEQYFRGVEAIASAVEGRPHWGKLHFQTAATLAPRYPGWERFAEARRRLDPEGRFANAYLDRVLGPPAG
jgi:FAD-linked oxidoreductase